MKTWDKFLKDVLPKVPGCPEPVAEHALLRAAQEFLDTTRLWKRWLDPVVTREGVMEYDLELEPSSELVRLERATLDGRPITCLAQDELPTDWQTYPNTVCDCVHTVNGRTLILLPPSAGDLSLSIEASLKPADGATGIEDELFARYLLPIAHGAVSLLKEDTTTSYGDPAGAMRFRGLFDEAMTVNEFRRARGFSNTEPRRRARTF
ncbi:MAG: hypothetical protein KF686_03365 [Ramlibacter sp.]|nr:hypothetical protein [Ramlibacter sp.]